MTLEATEIDLRGLKCPLPVLRTRKALSGAKTGAVFLVRCTDPLAALDIPHFARTEGHTVHLEPEAKGILTFRIVKGGAIGGVDGQPFATT
jgi:tRNA 2-thiouridine synthesizing protein A